MFVASDYPFLDVFWTMLIFFLWVIWIWFLIIILTDVFRRRDIHGGKKAVWCIFIIFLPDGIVGTWLKRRARRADAVQAEGKAQIAVTEAKSHA